MRNWIHSVPDIVISGAIAYPWGNGRALGSPVPPHYDNVRRQDVHDRNGHMWASKRRAQSRPLPPMDRRWRGFTNVGQSVSISHKDAQTRLGWKIFHTLSGKKTGPGKGRHRLVGLPGKSIRRTLPAISITCRVESCLSRKASQRSQTAAANKDEKSVWQIAISLIGRLRMKSRLNHK